jgi:hypothetical protein
LKTLGSFYPGVFAISLFLKDLAKWQYFHYSHVNVESRCTSVPDPLVRLNVTDPQTLLTGIHVVGVQITYRPQGRKEARFRPIPLNPDPAFLVTPNADSRLIGKKNPNTKSRLIQASGAKSTDPRVGGRPKMQESTVDFFTFVANFYFLKPSSLPNHRRSV